MTTETAETTEPISIEISKGCCFSRWPCTVCGSQTEKTAVLASGENMKIIVCERCLEGGDGIGIDDRLELHARSLENEAVYIRNLVGRLRVPTFAEWYKAVYGHAPPPTTEDTEDTDLPFDTEIPF